MPALPSGSLLSCVPVKLQVYRESAGVTRPALSPLATGVLLCDMKQVYLVTARHVVRGLDSVVVELRRRGGGSRQLTVGVGHCDFVYPPDAKLDLTMVALPDSEMADTTLDYMLFDTTASLSPRQIVPGLPVLVLGFPLGLGSGSNTPAVKSGIVALVPPDQDSFYIDSNLFPGNSGGPVITSAKAIGAQLGRYYVTSQDAPLLVGIASHTLTYSDTAVSAQTHRARVTFEENSGLAVVISAARIWQFISTGK
jgi:hypothetical protein